MVSVTVVKSDRDTLKKVEKHVRKRAFLCVERQGDRVQQFCR